MKIDKYQKGITKTSVMRKVRREMCKSLKSLRMLISRFGYVCVKVTANKVIISKTDLAFSLDGKPVYGVDKKEFAKLFNEFVNAVAGEFNINVEGYVADETAD